MNTLKTKLLTLQNSERFIWKTLGSILLVTLSFGVFIIKYAFDLEGNLGHLQEENSILQEKVNRLSNLIQNQDQKIIVEDSYWQYFTIKNVCYFTITIGVIGAGLWFFKNNPDFFPNAPLEKINESTLQEIQTPVETTTNVKVDIEKIDTTSRFYIKNKTFGSRNDQ